MATVREPDVQEVVIAKLSKCDGILQALKRYTPYYYEHVLMSNLSDHLYDNCTVFAFEDGSACRCIGECISFCRNTLVKGVITPNALTSSPKMILPSVGDANLIIESFDGGEVFVNTSKIDFSISCADGVVYVIYDNY